MSLFSRLLMTRKDINYRSPGFYDPEHRSPKTNAIVVAVFCVLFGGALWISLTDTLDKQQKFHCEQGWQPACESLKQ
jgi:hypothetical protein